MVLSGPNKVSSSSSMTNQTCHFGIMGGLAPSVGLPAGSRMFRLRRAKNKQQIPTGCVPGLEYMKEHDILSKNPAGSGGIGLTSVLVDRSMGPCNCGAPTAANTVVVSADSLNGVDGLDGVDGLETTPPVTVATIIETLNTQYSNSGGDDVTVKGSGILISMFDWPNAGEDETATAGSLGWTYRRTKVGKQGITIGLNFLTEADSGDKCIGDHDSVFQTVGWKGKIDPTTGLPPNVDLNILCPNYTGPGSRCGIESVEGKCSAMGKVVSFSYIREDLSTTLPKQIPNMLNATLVSTEAYVPAASLRYVYDGLGDLKFPYSPASRFIGDQYGKFFIIYNNTTATTNAIDEQILCSFALDGETGGNISTICDGMGKGVIGQVGVMDMARAAYNPETKKWTGVTKATNPVSFKAPMLEVQRALLEYGRLYSAAADTPTPIYNEVLVKSWNLAQDGPSKKSLAGGGDPMAWGWKDALETRPILAFGVIGDGTIGKDDAGYQALSKVIGTQYPIVALNTNSPLSKSATFGFYEVTDDTHPKNIPVVHGAGFQVDFSSAAMPSADNTLTPLAAGEMAYAHVSWTPAESSKATNTYTITLYEQQDNMELVSIKSYTYTSSAKGTISYYLPFPKTCSYTAPHWLAVSQNGGLSTLDASKSQISNGYLKPIATSNWYGGNSDTSDTPHFSYWLEICTPGFGAPPKDGGKRTMWQMTARDNLNATLYSYGGLAESGYIEFTDGKVVDDHSQLSFRGSSSGPITIEGVIDVGGDGGLTWTNAGDMTGLAVPKFKKAERVSYPGNLKDAADNTITFKYKDTAQKDQEIQCSILAIEVGNGTQLNVLTAALDSKDRWSMTIPTYNMIDLIPSIDGLIDGGDITTPNITAATLIDSVNTVTGITMTTHYSYPVNKSTQVFEWDLASMGEEQVNHPKITMAGSLFGASPIVVEPTIETSTPITGSPILTTPLIAPINILALYSGDIAR